MTKTIHQIDPAFKGRPKSQLLHCKICDASTLQITAFFGYPFRCVANHGGKSLCGGCDTYTAQVAKVTVDNNGDYTVLCELCAGPESPEKQRLIAQRRAKAVEAAHNPVDLSDPESFARALGASSFSGRK